MQQILVILQMNLLPAVFQNLVYNLILCNKPLSKTFLLLSFDLVPPISHHCLGAFDIAVLISPHDQLLDIRPVFLYYRACIVYKYCF